MSASNDAGYKPQTGVFSYALPEAHGGWGDGCGIGYTFTQAKATIATVLTDRRYVVGAHTTYRGEGPGVFTDPSWMLTGARVRYTCPATCS